MRYTCEYDLRSPSLSLSLIIFYGKLKWRPIVRLPAEDSFRTEQKIARITDSHDPKPVTDLGPKEKK